MRPARPRMERTPDGRYRCWWEMENRCCRTVRVGWLLICVMNEYGFLVTVDQEPPEWS